MKVKSITCSNPQSIEIIVNKWLEKNQKTTTKSGETIIDIKYNIAVAVSPENNRHDPPEIASLYWAMIHYE